MSTSVTSRTPLHAQISEMIAQEIQSGLLIAGQKLAPEREMAAKLSVSVGTLRKALHVLEEKGLLIRVHGSGNYVREDLGLNHLELVSMLKPTESQAPLSTRTVSLECVRKPSDLPEIGDSKQAHRIRRILLLDVRLVALEEVWLDASQATKFDQENLPDCLYDFYKEQFGLTISRVEDRVGVAALPIWANQVSPCTSDTARFGFVERSARNESGDIVEFSRTWYHSKYIQFVSVT